jgi:hypothetical protein
MIPRIDTATAWLLTGLGMTLLMSSILVVPPHAFANSSCSCPSCDSFCDPSKGGDPNGSWCQSCLATLGCCGSDATCKQGCCQYYCGSDQTCAETCCNTYCGGDQSCLNTCYTTAGYSSSCPPPRVTDLCDVNNGNPGSCPGLICTTKTRGCLCVYDPGTDLCNCPP